MSPIARSGCAAALLLLTLAAPAEAQERDLRQHDGSPISGLTREALDSVAEERLDCRQMVQVIDRLAELLSAATSGERTEEFHDFQARAASEFRFARAGCDRRIASVDDGWPRAVLDAEYELASRLWASLLVAATAFAEEASVEDVNSRIQAYDQVLAEWISWLQLAGGFWTGRYLQERPGGCLQSAQDGVDGLRGRLQELDRVPPGHRSQDELEDLGREIDRARADLALCDGARSVDALEVRALDLILAAFVDAVPALKSGDDDAWRRAMGREQEHVSRLVRCRREHSVGEVSADCTVTR